MKQFDVIPLQRPKTSVFDLSHEKKLSIKMGDLVPILCQEVLPGDRFRLNTEVFMRLQPMIAPIMHRINARVEYFYIPKRLVWNEWEQFITGGKKGSAVPVYPQVAGGSDDAETLLTIGSLADYLGFPVQMITPSSSALLKPISLTPFRAYQLVYNTYYRDQDLEDEIPIDLSSGVFNYDNAEVQQLLTLRKRAWEKDYFTSSRPWAQKGDDVLLPLNGTAPVSGNVRWDTASGLASSNTVRVSGGTLQEGAAPYEDMFISANTTGLANPVHADLSEATSTTITELRRAFALQRWLEKQAIGGSRMAEFLLHMFGVKSPDARLQNPEYLGGGKLPMMISEVLQTGESGTTPQGNMSGHGYATGISNGFSKYFYEHGYVIGILSVVPRTSYMQGLPKLFTKLDRFDYYFDQFAHIGEQPVKKYELYYDPELTTQNEQEFGYQARYQEYRFNNDTVHGEMRTSLKHYHMAREFSAMPSLNNSFVKADPTTRIFAVTSEEWHKLICDIYFDFKAIRPVSKYGTPI